MVYNCTAQKTYACEAITIKVIIYRPQLLNSLRRLPLASCAITKMHISANTTQHTQRTPTHGYACAYMRIHARARMHAHTHVKTNARTA